MMLPTEVDGYDRYLGMSSLQQTIRLSGNELAACHHLLRESVQASPLLAGAWCQVELAHIRDAFGKRAEAQELLALASNQLWACRTLVEHRYGGHPQYWDRLYRTRLLSTYVPHFAQLGPTHWPDRPTEFQRDAYSLVQTELVNPLLEDYKQYKGVRVLAEQRKEGILRGLLGEMVVLQSLNRLQRDLDYTEWAVAPASLRENSSTSTANGANAKAFDVKLTFADQTFVPLEVKWREPNPASDREERAYDPRIALVYANEGAHRSAVAVAHAMRREVSGERPHKQDAQQLEMLTDSVMGAIDSVQRLGVGIYGNGMESLASELSLQALLTPYRERTFKA